MYYKTRFLPVGLSSASDKWRFLPTPFLSLHGWFKAAKPKTDAYHVVITSRSFVTKLNRPVTNSKSDVTKRFTVVIADREVGWRSHSAGTIGQQAKRGSR